MAARNSERLLNLVIALLAAPRFLTRDQIRDLVAGYGWETSDDAFLRMFERDKEDLRSLGVEIEVGHATASGEDGYRIRAAHYYLPDIQLTGEESTLIGLASSVWNEPVMAGYVAQALAKLRAGGEQIGDDQVSYLAPRLNAHEPGFPVLWEALLSRAPVEFVYHGRERHVRGWKMILRSGAWYLLGEDAGVGARLFRLSRIESAVRRTGEPGSYVMPPSGVIAEHARRLEPATGNASVLVGLRQGRAGQLRRRGIPEPATAPDGFDSWRIPYARGDEIVQTICAAGPDAVVLEDGEIRDQVMARLRAVAGWVS